MPYAFPEPGPITNQLPNPSVETTLWPGGAFTSSAADTTWSASGGTSQRLTRTGLAQGTFLNAAPYPGGVSGLPVTPGQVVNAGLTVNVRSLTNVMAVAANIDFYTSAGGYLTSASLGTTRATGIFAWTTSPTVPNNAAYMGMTVQLNTFAAGSGTSDGDFSADRAWLGYGVSVGYTDGDQSGYYWDDVPHASVTRRAPASTFVEFVRNCNGELFQGTTAYAAPLNLSDTDYGTAVAVDALDTLDVRDPVRVYNEIVNPSGDVSHSNGWDFSNAQNMPYNLVPNPSAEVDTTGHAFNSSAGAGSGGTLVRSTAWALSGTASILVSQTTAGVLDVRDALALIPVTAGQPYTAQCAINVLVASDAGTQLVLRYRQSDATTIIAGSQVNSTAQTTTGVGYHSVSSTAPAGAAYAEIIVIANAPTTAAATSFYVDCLQLVQSSTVQHYADGSYPGFNWAGTAYNSITRRTWGVINLIGNTGGMSNASTGFSPFPAANATLAIGADSFFWGSKNFKGTLTAMPSGASWYPIYSSGGGGTGVDQGQGMARVWPGAYYAVRAAIKINTAITGFPSGTKIQMQLRTRKADDTISDIVVTQSSSDATSYAAGSTVILSAVFQTPADAVKAGPNIIVSGASAIAAGDVSVGNISMIPVPKSSTGSTPTFYSPDQLGVLSTGTQYQSPTMVQPFMSGYSGAYTSGPRHLRCQLMVLEGWFPRIAQANFVPVSGNTDYFLQTWYSVEAITSGLSLSLGVDWYDSTQTFISRTFPPGVTGITSGNGTKAGTLISPSNAAYAKPCLIAANGLAGWIDTQIDGIMFEEGARTDYFDGGYANAYWEGTAHFSRSYKLL